ncbi:CAP domain-containing protein [Citricoccus sp. CH26A]|uniref:CAP domain-containing protein n=1 Tax=Citricoccus TaxID=169133 RepID=UPI001300C80B|nr:CAP domain-containing protein [Citricoccus sp. CH26A]
MYRSVAAVVIAGGLLASGVAPASSAPGPVAAPQPAAASCTAQSPPSDVGNAMAWEIHRLVNEQRTQNGLAALEVDQGVSNAAIKHSQNMARTGIFSHVINGKGPADRLKDENVSFSAYGENIYHNWCQMNGKPAYAVDGFPHKAVTAWMNSAGHRANILNPDFTHTGIGIWAIPRDNKGYMYTTQVFIKR